METKVCRRCGEARPLSRFVLNKHGDRRPDCRNCPAPAPRETKVAIPEFRRKLRGQRFIITSAQNATPIHEPAFAALLHAAESLGAELVVIPLRYKNPTSIWTENNANDDWWGIPEWQEQNGETNPLRPYLYNGRKKLNANLMLCADVKSQPTASSPLTGFEALTGAESFIIGHPKMQFRSIPAPSNNYPKIGTTTGTITVANSTDSRAGKLADFHRFVGAIMVEIDGPKFHIRQLNCDKEDGSFIDLDVKYTADGPEEAPPALALVMGDTHVTFTSTEVDKATFGEGGIAALLKPKMLVWHDLFDGYSVNPHHAGNPFISHAKQTNGLGDVEAEVRKTVDFVVQRTPIGTTSVIVPSNHDNFLSRWMVASDWRSVGNKRFYLETALAMLDSVSVNEGGTTYADPFVHWVRKLTAPLVGEKCGFIVCPDVDEPVLAGNIELNNHGDRGPDGTRGSMKRLARIGSRLITGHRHGPAIEEGHYGVGTSTPRKLEYTRGPSSWLNTHCVVYANGRRSLISIIDGQWRLA
jgi:hypothetical protein